MTKTAAQALGMLAILNDFGHKVEAELHSDSNAAIGIVHREGLSRTRHIKVQFLWLQEKVKDKSLVVSKVGTEHNKADLMTKNLPADSIKKHLESMNVYMCPGRARSIPTLKCMSARKGNQKEAAESKRKRQLEYEKRARDREIIKNRNVPHVERNVSEAPQIQINKLVRVGEDPVRADESKGNEGAHEKRIRVINNLVYRKN